MMEDSEYFSDGETLIEHRGFFPSVVVKTDC